MKGKLDSRQHDNVHNNWALSFDNLKIDYDKRPKKVQLVGIINVTPDSFFDGGRYVTAQAAIDRGYQLIEEGADWLDIGAESSRPFANPISAQEELHRLMPVVEALAPHFQVSVDTYKYEVAAYALDHKVKMINDISGFSDIRMAQLLRDYPDVLGCVMHRQGCSQTMQINPHYPCGVMPALLEFFNQKVTQLQQWGVDNKQIILDPGIGFGKSTTDCFDILKHLSSLQALGYPIYLGLSRKSFLQKTLNKSADALLPATLICATVSALAGCNYLRVHDVQAHAQMRTLLELIC
jgi:dihydropteroate synthase